MKGGMVKGGDLRYKVSMEKGGGTMRGKTFLGNAFSLGMLPVNATEIKLRVKIITLEDVKKLTENGFESCIGHESTASILTELLGKEVRMNRIPITLEKGDIIIVFQIIGRLEEGKILTRNEIEKLNYRFYLVEIEETE